jgi:signal transduction histidine kinase
MPRHDLQAIDALRKSASSSDSLSIDRQPTNRDPSVDAVLSAHDYERQRLGQELHDTAGQMVVSLQFSIANLKRVHEESARNKLLEEIQNAVLRIDQELRSLAFLSYPAELGGRSPGAAVQALTAGFRRRTGIKATFRSDGDTAGADQPTAVALLRVAQEALVNIHRHSHATEAQVAVECRDEEIRLTVSDNGVGMPTSERAQQSPGIGLQGMRYRVESLGGRFSVRNLKQGLRITATVPNTMRRRKVI